MTNNMKIDKIIDLKGEVCPFPWVKAKKTLATMQVGQTLKIIVDHAPAFENIPFSFIEEGQRIILEQQISELEWVIVVEKIK